MMKLINSAYDTLKDFEGSLELEGLGLYQYGEQINNALNAIIEAGLNIEICGSWVWVSGDTKPHKEVLREAGFKWSNKKLRWYFRPDGYKSRPHQAWPMEKIKEVYGSKTIKPERQLLSNLG